MTRLSRVRLFHCGDEYACDGRARVRVREVLMTKEREISKCVKNVRAVKGIT